MSVEIPARLARTLGATHVISVHLPAQGCSRPPQNMFQVINRAFQIMQANNEQSWRDASDLVITPDVRMMEWDGFEAGPELVKAGEAAAAAAIPRIKAWFPAPAVAGCRKPNPGLELA
jgi:predicted acylesterase/phospholipase RssA